MLPTCELRGVTPSEGSGWGSDHACSHRAAFQYGIKMSEGRKTRRFKETNEKAELDRQWKKISAVRFPCSSYMKRTQNHRWLVIKWIGPAFQIIEKRKKMEADGWVLVSRHRISRTIESLIYWLQLTNMGKIVFQGGCKEAQILKMAANRCGVLICDY